MDMRPKKHALIVAHPNPQSFTFSVADAYKSAVESRGHSVIVRDLYGLNFDPKLRNGEIPRPSGFAPDADVMAERALIGDAEVFCLVYPVWFYVPPAVLVGYIQRVFGMGFGYGPQRKGENQRLLLGRSLISFSSSGSPAEWMRTEGGWDALCKLFDQHFADVCGLSVLDHKHFGRILNSTPSVRIEAHLKEVRDAVAKQFAPRL
jgi:NAD(P)H dehydrogenase (quinone)